jgi:glycosyltransferase involved in cell wall biosynthesis
MPSQKPHILLMGQTPPPWHGQAVATQILFDHSWPEFEVHRLRMEFSGDMLEVGRFQWKKLHHLWSLIRQARCILKENPSCVLLYPPASAKWVPFLRDLIFLHAVRHLAGATVFIFHASGLPVFVSQHWLKRRLAKRAYHGVEVSLEVAQEEVPPHQVFQAKTSRWCPCGIEVPELRRQARGPVGPYQVLFVASLQEGKGLLELLRTAAHLKQQGKEDEFCFQVVGRWFSDEFEKEAHTLRTELGLERMVNFVGQLTGNDKWQAYQNADVFFFPTHYASEATPIVLMEALGMGLPIVSTQWAGIPAMLEGCHTAHLLPIHSPQSYADALVGLAARRGNNAATAEQSQAFYRDHFLPERFIERVADAFRVAIQLTSPPMREEDTNVVTPHSSEIAISVYLADQNPKLGRSLGISRMTEVMLQALDRSQDIHLTGVSSESSIQILGSTKAAVLPWNTRGALRRILTDNLHPLFRKGQVPDGYYFPKGFLPRLHWLCSPSVVTIHDTIIQYYSDVYPKWRTKMEYRYWASMLKYTLRHATCILTVSESAKTQIRTFMERHGIPEKEILVTYEPCLYESLPQPAEVAKEDYVIHLASREPHKRTAHLIQWWHEAEMRGDALPTLHLIGTVPSEVAHLLTSAQRIVGQPFLKESALEDAYRQARVLILPSEIEGFGLPALEAYYLGTPVCYVKGTSVEEVLRPATAKGGFNLDDAASLFSALDEVMTMSPEEVKQCGLKLRETYAAEKVVERMIDAFRRVAAGSSGR